MNDASLGGAQGNDAGNRPAVGHILVVCTGNICRSPYIERRLAGLLADTDAVVTSAGTRALVGAPIEPGSAELEAALSMVEALVEGGTPRGDAAKTVAAATGIQRRRLYRTGT